MRLHPEYLVVDYGLLLLGVLLAVTGIGLLIWAFAARRAERLRQRASATTPL